MVFGQITRLKNNTEAMPLGYNQLVKNSKLRGYLYIILATLIYGLYGIFSRQAKDFGPFSQGAIRYSMVCAFVIALYSLKKVSWVKIEQKDIKWFLLWILPASIQPIITFIAFVHLPVGLTYFLIYSTMILGGTFSGKIFFGEKFDDNKKLSLMLVLLGLFLIYSSDITLVKSVYFVAALLSGLIVGFWNTLTKKVSNKYPEFQMILLDSSSTLIVGTIGALAVKESLPSFQNVETWLWITAFAFLGILSSLLLIKGFKYVEAQTGSLIMPMELVFSSIFSFIFLGELLKFNAYTGGLFILLAALLPVINFSNRKK